MVGNAEVQKIRELAPTMSVAEIAKTMHKSNSCILDVMRRYSIPRYKKPRDTDRTIYKTGGYNKNPISCDTELLVCRYFAADKRNGMTDAAAVKEIADELNRSEMTVIDVLNRCRANGMYKSFNKYDWRDNAATYVAMLKMSQKGKMQE